MDAITLFLNHLTKDERKLMESLDSPLKSRVFLIPLNTPGAKETARRLRLYACGRRIALTAGFLHPQR